MFVADTNIIASLFVDDENSRQYIEEKLLKEEIVTPSIFHEEISNFFVSCLRHCVKIISCLDTLKSLPLIVEEKK